MKPRMLGLEDLEKEQKQEQKKKSAEKKMEKARETVDAKEEKADEKKVVKKSSSQKKKGQVGPGKKYLAMKKKVDDSKKYHLKDAVALLKELKHASFDEAVDLHLNVDKTGLKGEVELPHSTGKTVRVAILDDKLLEQIGTGKIEFDILITHPSYMPKLARFAKILGPKGLMPNPKAGTISANPEEVAKKFSKGMLRWKTEPKFPLIHQTIGKISFDDAKLVENAVAFIQSVGKMHILNAYIAITMGPSIKIDLEKI